MANGLKVFFRHRADLFSKPQADTVVIDRYRESFQSRGVTIVQNEAEADVIHLFGLASCQDTELPTKPFCISPLLDLDITTAEYVDAVGRSLTAYVTEGQQQTNWSVPVQPTTASAFKCNKNLLFAAGIIFVQSKNEQAILENTLGALATTCLAPIGLPEISTAAAADFQNKFNVKDFILCVARIEPRKNQLMLLKAFERSPLPIVFVDGGLTSGTPYEHAVKNFKRAGQTVITGKIDQALITSAIKAAKVHVLPSFFEIPGVVSLEAVRHGCPVVATRNGSSADYLLDNAMYCNPADADSIYNATLAGFYGPRPEARVISLSWNEVSEIVITAYDTLLNNKQLKQERVVMETIQDTVDKEIETAEAFASQGNLAKALETVRALEESNPGDFRAQRALAALFLMQGKTKEAKARFTLAHKLNAADSKVLRGLALCARAENDTATAYELLAQAVQVNPNDSFAILELLKTSYSLKQFDVVSAALEKYCSKGEAEEDLVFSYAGVLFEQAKYAEAKKICETILVANPASTDATQLLSRIAGATTAKKPATPEPVAATPVVTPAIAAQAKPSLSESVSQTRYNATPTPEALLAQLEEFRRNMKVEELRKGLDDVRAIQMTLSTTQKQRAFLLTADYEVLIGNLDGAYKVFEEVAKDDPYSTRALCGLGALSANSGKWAEAQRFFSKAIALDARQDVAYAGLGLCAKQDGQTDRAWGFYKTALSINPENMRALLGLMEIGYPMKKYDEIEHALRAYLELHPADTEFSYSLAGCLFAQDRLDAATDAINMILTFKPEDKRAHELFAAINSKKTGALVGNSPRY